MPTYTISDIYGADYRAGDVFYEKMRTERYTSVSAAAKALHQLRAERKKNNNPRDSDAVRVREVVRQGVNEIPHSLNVADQKALDSQLRNIEDQQRMADYDRAQAQTNQRQEQPHQQQQSGFSAERIQAGRELQAHQLAEARAKQDAVRAARSVAPEHAQPTSETPHLNPEVGHGFRLSAKGSAMHVAGGALVLGSVGMAVAQGHYGQAAQIAGGYVGFAGGLHATKLILAAKGFARAAKVVPVVGEVIGAGMGTYSAVQSARSGHYARAGFDGVQAGLYAVAGVAAATGVGAPVAAIAGGLAFGMTAAEFVYDNHAALAHGASSLWNWAARHDQPQHPSVKPVSNDLSRVRSAPPRASIRAATAHPATPPAHQNPNDFSRLQSRGLPHLRTATATPSKQAAAKPTSSPAHRDVAQRNKPAALHIS